MPALRRVLSALVLTCFAASGCTLCKPVVGLVYGPVVMLGNSNGDWGGCGCNGDGRAIAAVFAVAAVVGATAGLVTGVISDVQALTGEPTDPCRNWWDPFKTNTSN